MANNPLGSLCIKATNEADMLAFCKDSVTVIGYCAFKDCFRTRHNYLIKRSAKQLIFFISSTFIRIREPSNNY